MSSTKICPRCGYSNPIDAKFCLNCGYDFRLQPEQPSRMENSSPTAKVCPRCGYSNPIDAKFCLNCGYNFESATQPTYNQPQQPYSTPSSPQPYYNQPVYQSPSFDVAKLKSYVPKVLLPGGILFSVAVILVSVGYILFTAVPEIQAGGSYAAAGGLTIAALAIYLISGILLIVPTIRSQFNVGTISILSILGFLYMILWGIFDIMGHVDSIGVEFILAGVFLLVSLFTIRSRSLGIKFTGVTFALVAGILYFVAFLSIQNFFSLAAAFAAGLSSISVGGTSFSNSSFGALAAVFTNFAGFLSSNSYIYLALTSVIILGVALYLEPFSYRYVAVSIVYKLMRYIALLLFTIGVLVLGASFVASGIASTSGFSAAEAAGYYLIFTAGVLDIPAGVLLMISSVFLLIGAVKDISETVKKSLA